MSDTRPLDKAQQKAAHYKQAGLQRTAQETAAYKQAGLQRAAYKQAGLQRAAQRRVKVAQQKAADKQAAREKAAREKAAEKAAKVDQLAAEKVAARKAADAAAQQAAQQAAQIATKGPGLMNRLRRITSNNRKKINQDKANKNTRRRDNKDKYDNISKLYNDFKDIFDKIKKTTEISDYVNKTLLSKVKKLVGFIGIVKFDFKSLVINNNINFFVYGIFIKKLNDYKVLTTPQTTTFGKMDIYSHIIKLLDNQIMDKKVSLEDRDIYTYKLLSIKAFSTDDNESEEAWKEIFRINDSPPPWLQAAMVTAGLGDKLPSAAASTWLPPPPPTHAKSKTLKNRFNAALTVPPKIDSNPPYTAFLNLFDSLKNKSSLTVAEKSKMQTTVDNIQTIGPVEISKLEFKKFIDKFDEPVIKPFVQKIASSGTDLKNIENGTFFKETRDIYSEMIKYIDSKIKSGTNVEKDKYRVIRTIFENYEHEIYGGASGDGEWIRRIDPMNSAQYFYNPKTQVKKWQLTEGEKEMPLAAISDLAGDAWLRSKADKTQIIDPKYQALSHAVSCMRGTAAMPVKGGGRKTCHMKKNKTRKNKK